MTGKIINLSEYKATHLPDVERYEVICLFCAHRYMQEADTGVMLKDMCCPSCNMTGGIILTGQQFNDEGEPR